MDREQLLAYLDACYPGWHKKLRNMPTEQLYAIYCRVRNTKPPKKSKKAKAPVTRAEYHYIYECDACYAQYETDNPDEQECRYCGSPRPGKYDRRRRA